jgi:hypothetical protein
MLPVVSIAISMSAFGGTSGTPTVFVSCALAPGWTLSVAVVGERLAEAPTAPSAARATAPLVTQSAVRRSQRRAAAGAAAVVPTPLLLERLPRRTVRPVSGAAE